MIPPMFRRLASPDKGRAGKLHEPSLARRLNATLTPASGAMSGAKGDMHLNQSDFLLEGKTTTSASFVLKQEYLLKISKEATAVGKRAALSVCFVNSQGESKSTDRWVMVREAEFLAMLERTPEE